MNNHDEWFWAGVDNGWEMPRVVWWKRLPVIRHIRAIYHQWEVNHRNQMYQYMGMIPTGYDDWICYGIWHKQERRDEKD
jgi:hypothetical protein